MKMRRRTRQRKLKARLLRKRGTTRSKPAAGKQPKKKSSGGKE
jgi:hypothetical protein